MGIPEMTILFNEFDSHSKGYLTPRELQNLHEAIHCQSVDIEHIESTLHQLYGDTRSLITLVTLADILEELQRRMILDDDLRWTFMSLAEGDMKVSPENALLLFEATLDDKFSPELWDAFINSRGSRTAAIAYDEIKFWLINDPPPLQRKERPDADWTKKEKERIHEERLQADRDLLESFKSIEDPNSRALHEERQRNEYKSWVQTAAARKLKRLKLKGPRAFLEDDYTDPSLAVDEMIPAHEVTLSDILQMIDRKYDTIRELLLNEIFLTHRGYFWMEASEEKKRDIIDNILMVERKLRESAALSENMDDLGDFVDLTLPFELYAAMDYVGSTYHAKMEEHAAQIQSLKEQNKSFHEVNDEVKAQFLRSYPGRSSVRNLLIALSERQCEEKSEVNKLLKGQGENSEIWELKMVVFCQLLKQMDVFASLGETHTTLIKVGLGERTHHYSKLLKIFSPDRFRQEEITREMLVNCVGLVELPPHYAVYGVPEGVGRIDLIKNIVQEELKKDEVERKALGFYLFSPQAHTKLLEGSKKSKEERKRRMKQLDMKRYQWRFQKQDTRKRTAHMNHDSLAEAVVLRWLHLRDADLSDRKIHSRIMADLQQKQDEEFIKMAQRLVYLSAEELLAMRYDVAQSGILRIFDNLAHVLFASVESIPEEDVLNRIVGKKYDEIRRKIFEDICRRDKSWGSLTTEQQNKEVEKLVRKEFELREAESREDIDKMVSSIDKTLPALSSLIGPHIGVINKIRTHHKRNMEQGDYMDGLTSGEDVNLLVDLIHRQDEELDELINEVATAGAQKVRIITNLYVQSLWASLEQEFESSAILVGLLERLDDIADSHLEDRRPAKDLERNKRLALLRYKMRKYNSDYVEDVLARSHSAYDVCYESFVTLIDESFEPREAFFWEVYKKHLHEWDYLVKLFDDRDFEGVIESAATIPHEEKINRLFELQSIRARLSLDNEDDLEENCNILEEAGALAYTLRDTSGRMRDRENVILDFLTTLQDYHFMEILKHLDDVPVMTKEKLESQAQIESSLRKKEVCDNVFAVFIKYCGETPDHELMKELDNKYDHLRDKLLTELLMKQLGEAGWAALSERERQQRLAQLKLLERQLRKEGRLDELASLLDQELANGERLRQLMGSSREEHERKLRERLAARKARGASFEEEDSGIEEDEQENNEGPICARDLLNDLDLRLEEEKQALLAKLRGVDVAYLTERERQAELLRLRREALKASQEGDFATAAMLMGLLERQSEDSSARLKGDRERQAELAKRRMQELRENRGQKEIKFSATNKPTAGAGHLITLIETKHKQEETYFSQWLDRLTDDEVQFIELSTALEREEMLTKLRSRISGIAREDDKKRHPVLMEATTIKAVMRSASFGKELDMEKGKIDLMADLNSLQNTEAEMILTGLESWSKEEINKMQATLVAEINNSVLPNVEVALFRPEPACEHLTDDDVVRELENKYDSLRDKLLLEALIKKFGESEWKRMSEQQRQKELMLLRLKERQLRREGNYEELERLLGDALRNDELISQLMNETREDVERRLKERLALRMQRLAEGMTEEEVTRLEDEEMQDENKRRRNVLLDLDYQFDKDREELLRQLQKAKDAHEAEKARQLALARLRRDQALTNQEDSLLSAALILGLADVEARLKDADRERQLQLARERLAAARARRDAGGKMEDEGALPLINENDSVALKAGIIDLLELGHRRERNILIESMAEIREKGWLHQYYNMSIEELHEELVKLADERKSLIEIDAGRSEEMNVVLKTAIAIRMAITEKENQQDDTEVLLLSNLQSKQMEESSEVQNEILNKVLQELREIYAEYKDMTEKGSMDNLIGTVFGEAQVSKILSEEEEIKKALNVKYDAIKDKLLMEALMKQCGEAAWARMSEKERQAKLAKLKLEHHQLLRQGKQNEAAALFNKLIKNESDLSDALAETASEQSARLAARRAQLREERAKAGLSTDATSVEVILEEEEGERAKMRRANILDQLQHDHDAEKERLLAALRDQDSTHTKEKLRQQELMRLKREARELCLEDNGRAALMVIAAQRQAEGLHAGLVSERDRQQKLAQERLAAARQRRKGTGSDEKVDVLTEEVARKAEWVAPREHVIREVQSKHKEERDLLALLLNDCVDKRKQIYKLVKKDVKVLSNNLNAAKVKFDIAQERITFQNIGQMSTKEKKKYSKEAEKLKVTRISALEEGIKFHCAMRMKDDRRVKLEDIAVDMMASLQVQQDIELESLDKTVDEFGDDKLSALQVAEQQARTEAWSVQLAPLVFNVSDSQRVRREGQAVGAEALLNEFKEQDTQKRKELDAQRARSLDAVRKRLEKRSEAVLNQGNEAVALVLAVDEQEDALAQAKALVKTQQSSVMRERLEARRAQQKAKAEEEERHRSMDDVADQVEVLKRRESSVLNVLEFTDEDKQAQAEKLLSEQSELYKRTQEEQKRQEELLRERLAQQKTNRTKKTHAVLQLGERQKTFVEQKKEVLKERHSQEVKDRVAKLRYERTLTTHYKKDSPAVKDAEEEDEVELPADYDTRMEEDAARLQAKFRRQEEDVRRGVRDTNLEEDEVKGEEDGSGDEEGRSMEQVILERIKARRQQRRQAKPTAE